MAATDPALQLLLDRAAIEDVMTRYALAADRCNWELLASCFAPDVGGRFGPLALRGRNDLVEYVSGLTRFHTTMHLLGNQFIEVDGDRASAETLGMLTHRGTRRNGSEWQFNRSDARYCERLARRDGHWVIAERGVEPAWADTGVTAVTSEDPSLRWLLDRAEIHDVLVQYALGIDRRDYARIGHCFAPRFRARYGEHEFTDLNALLAFIAGVERFARPRTSSARSSSRSTATARAARRTR